MLRSNPPVFTANRREPELIAPAKPTPGEVKPLSDIDDQETLRFQGSVVLIYPPPRTGTDTGKNPATVIREALAQALVYYYPFAGRLREIGPNRKLAVDCTGEGLLFIEADADITLTDLIGHLHEPFPSFKEFVYDVPGSSGIINCPLFLIQVTRLKCGGFVFALRMNHTITDGVGLFMFLNATTEFALGASRPSMSPVWKREILCSRHPPRVSFPHLEYEEVDDPLFPLYTYADDNRMIHRCFFFGTKELFVLREQLQPSLRGCSTFELLAAFLWRCRTIALRLDPHEKVRLLCLVNARNKFNPPLPVGYYGNTMAFPVAISTSEKISAADLEYPLNLIIRAKAEVSEEYVRSSADLLAARGRPHVTVARSWVIFDNTRLGYEQFDFGWGKAVYGGPTSPLIRMGHDELISPFIKGKNGTGESGVMVPICLPAVAMVRFEREVNVCELYSKF